MNVRLKPAARVSLAAALALAVTTAAVPAHAGFLDQLFGGASSAPSQPTYEYQPQQAAPGLDFGTPIRRSKPRNLVAKEATPVRQKTTDLWHDKTLRVGDAVMMKDGVHLYLGSDGAKPRPNDFAKIDDVENVPKKQYAELTAVDSTRNDPLKAKGHTPDTLASGRSAAVAAPITKGFMITDARGRSLRYVGP